MNLTLKNSKIFKRVKDNNTRMRCMRPTESHMNTVRTCYVLPLTVLSSAKIKAKHLNNNGIVYAN